MAVRESVPFTRHQSRRSSGTSCRSGPAIATAHGRASSTPPILPERESLEARPHDRFDAGLIEEHLGPLRDSVGISHEWLMSLGRENPNNSNENFCMTVLGLKLARRANAVSALHGEVSRAMWTSLYPGRAEEAVPIRHITNGVHVPTWLAPQMFRLYDRHLGTGWAEHSGEPQIWEGIESVDDAELWETHLSLKTRLIEFARMRAPARWWPHS